MNEFNVDAILDAWLDLGPTSAPNRVAEAVRLEVRATHQTAIRKWWAPRRFPDTNNRLRLAVAAVAVVAIAALGYGLMQAGTIGQGPSEAPSPSGAPSPSQVPSPSAGRRPPPISRYFLGHPALSMPGSMTWVPIPRVPISLSRSHSSSLPGGCRAPTMRVSSVPMTGWGESTFSASPTSSKIRAMKRHPATRPWGRRSTIS